MKLICVFFLTLTSIISLAQQLPIASISSEIEMEGSAMVHTVTLSSTSTTDEIYDMVWSLDFDTVDFEDFNNSFYFDGIIFIPNTITVIVPAGTDSFTVSTLTFNDTIEENDEFYTLTISGISATGTIIDNDINTVILSVSDTTEMEGEDLIHTIYLSNPVSVTKNFPINIIDISTDVLDYDTIIFNNGITYDSLTEILTFPQTVNGIDHFTITIPTVDDLLIEDDESYSLFVDDVSGIGTIVDNDSVVITFVSDATENEGDDLVHTVGLSNINPTIKEYSFSLINNTTITTDYSAPIFSNGVILNASTNSITVPIGIESFTISVPTIDDAIDENNEFYNLYIEDFSATGTIIDNDTFSFPKYFTPNNDGIHDTWPFNLLDNNYFYNNAKIYIFDRYGKFLKEISSSSNGWDGTYNSKRMPVNDYWFKIVLQNGKIHTGHFTLKL